MTPGTRPRALVVSSWLAIVALGAPAIGVAQQPENTPESLTTQHPWIGQPAPVVQVVPPETLSVAPGVASEAEIRITVAKGYHVQANPAANQFLIPLTLTFDSGDDFEVGDIRYPPGELYRLQGADEDLLVYGGTFAVSVSVRVSAAVREGAVAAHGRLRYQACDDRLCLAPATLIFDLTARVESASVP